ncbi:hypothetical protein FQR65_LT17871 [Abscondita terminalis]|nr:hypothetical protein FQR65_LT17871 [Abscondita terminalis]
MEFTIQLILKNENVDVKGANFEVDEIEDELFHDETLIFNSNKKLIYSTVKDENIKWDESLLYQLDQANEVHVQNKDKELLGAHVKIRDKVYYILKNEESLGCSVEVFYRFVESRIKFRHKKGNVSLKDMKLVNNIIQQKQNTKAFNRSDTKFFAELSDEDMNRSWRSSLDKLLVGHKEVPHSTIQLALSFWYSIPLWNKNKGNQMKAEYEIQENKKTEERLKQELTSQVDTAYQTWKNQISKTAIIFPLETSGLRICETVYCNGILKNFQKVIGNLIPRCMQQEEPQKKESIVKGFEISKGDDAVTTLAEAQKERLKETIGLFCPVKIGNVKLPRTNSSLRMNVKTKEISRELLITIHNLFRTTLPSGKQVFKAENGIKIYVKSGNIDRLVKKFIRRFAQSERGREPGIIKNIGQPEVSVVLDRHKMAEYGVMPADAQSVLEMAFGGKTASQIYEGERKFDIRLRYAPEYRPAYKDVAAKYENTEPNRKMLAEKIIKGGQGVWGEIPMAPHADLTQAQAEAMAILLNITYYATTYRARNHPQRKTATAETDGDRALSGSGIC